MNISFRRKNGIPSLGIEFFWMLTIDTKSPIKVTDHFIPELFFDYFFVRKGEVKSIDKTSGTKYLLPRQAFKTIHTRPLTFVFSTPLVLLGARFSLGFAESFWEDDIHSNSFLEQKWVGQNTDKLALFASQVVKHVRKHRIKKTPYPLLSRGMKESDWLINFSARHKRRLYKTVFGLSRKELQNIHNVQLFLDQTCNFTLQNPRIIQHVNPEVFYDQPHLNHAFKKITGFSPVEYFQANSILQDNLMSASYNENSDV